MPAPILREDVFPFICQNPAYQKPACQEEYDVEGFIEVLNLWGLVYADCGDEVYQGITCTNCKGTSLLRLPRGNPVVDLREFIITPYPDDSWNTFEQVYEQFRTISSIEGGNDVLKFKSIPAWDSQSVSLQDMASSFKIMPHGPQPDAESSEPPDTGISDVLEIYYNELFDFYQARGMTYRTSHEVVLKRLQEENQTGRVRLRRLYPDTPQFRNLLTCLNHVWTTDVLLDEGVAIRFANGCHEEFRQHKAAWLGLYEQSTGKTLEGSVKSHLEYRGYSFDNKEFDLVLNQHLPRLRHGHRDRLQRLSTRVSFEPTVGASMRGVLEKFFHTVTTETGLARKRQELLGWTEEIETGQALFVDAPMGLGKTYSIVEALSKNREMSAVVFMPTNNLCEEIVDALKWKAAIQSKHTYDDIQRNTEELTDQEGRTRFDREGFPKSRFKREFLQQQIYFADGINEKECPHFDDIIKRYRENWIKKRDICAKCRDRGHCRFIRHKTMAPLSRIVVTTHAQYDHFHQESDFSEWFRDGTREGAVPRNVFIVDEDLVLSKCYQPISLYPKEVKDFTATVTTFLESYENTQGLRLKIKALFGQIKLCDETAIVRALDPDFTFPKNIARDWEKSLPKLPMIIPETLDWTDTVGNHLKLIENAIRVGVVVQKYEGRNRIYFHNPKTYDLAKLPCHVFFDGTMLAPEFRQHKLQGVGFERMKVKVEPLWQLKVWQNVNTDLPKKWIRRDKENAKSFVRSLLNELHDKQHRYFFVATKATRKRYLKDFLKKEFPQLDPVVVHYGNFRGTNNANDCDVGIMLGSYLLSDAVEIAMALDFIQDQLPRKDSFIPYGKDKLWTWQKSKGIRVYNEKYEVVSKLANSLRLYEQQQAIARTRHLFHDVDFYVLSKDPVNEYEPLARIRERHYRSDLFPPRSKRIDDAYEDVRDIALDSIDEHGWVTITGIHIDTGRSRTTIRKHLTELTEKEPLDRVKKGREIRYMSPSDNTETVKRTR